MSKYEILGLFGAAILLLLGFGVFVYVLLSHLKKMKAEFNETGFYPYGYFFQKGMIYSIPLAIIIGFLLLPYWSYLHKWSSILYSAPVIVPGLIIGYILEKKNADKVRPRDEKETRLRNRYQLLACGLLASLIIYKVFLQK